MKFDKEAFANVFGYDPTPEQVDWIDCLLVVSYADGYSEGENDATAIGYEEGYDTGYQEGFQDGQLDSK